MHLVYTSNNGVKIFVDPGSKSPNDFIVRYQEPGKRVRTPKHIHLVVDLFAKRTGNLELTNQLLDQIIHVINNIEPSTTFPPQLQIFNPSMATKFNNLNSYGEYQADFLLVISELIMIQEKTNYPTGTLNLRVYKKLRNGDDIFSIVSAATFR